MRILLGLLFAVMFSAAQAADGREQFSDPALEAAIEAMLTAGDDLAEVKFAADQLSGPPSSIGKARSELEQLTIALREMASGAATGADTLAALKRIIYEPGPWNGNRAFAYDLDDPLGQKPDNRRLANYLVSRRGNCVTMPILFVALGRGIGLDLTLAEAPYHLLVKYRDDSGALWNLEPTSGGGFTRDSHYRKLLPLTDKAVQAGTYLRALSSDEAAAIVASDLASFYLRSGKSEQAVITANALLRHHPRSAYLLVVKGSAYAQILRRDVIAKYRHASEMPPEVRDYAGKLYAENLAAFAAAEALGWTERDGLQ